MKNLSMIILFACITALANVAEYVPITRFHIESVKNDSIVFDLEMDKKGHAVSSSIFAFGEGYLLKDNELKMFDNVPIINFCMLEQGVEIIADENMKLMKECVDQGGNCIWGEMKKSEPLKYLYIRCGRGTHESVYLRYDSKGRLEIQIEK